jgi:hypothetical protein
MPLAAAAGPDLRVYLLVRDLQRQFAAYLVDVAMIGVAGRIYLSGPAAEIAQARDAIVTVFGEVEGRDHDRA